MIVIKANSSTAYSSINQLLLFAFTLQDITMRLFQRPDGCIIKDR